MKYTFKILMAAFVMALAFTSAVQAGDQAAKASTPPADNSSAALNRIKALEGRWQSTTSMFGKENEKVYTVYEVTSGGSAVVERQFPGTPNEMMSVYYDDEKGNLTMTHYCMMRNRPTLRLAKSEGDTMSFDVVKVEGLKSKDDPSMGAMTINFKDKDHYEATCKGRGKGAEDQPAHTMEFTRVSKK